MSHVLDSQGPARFVEWLSLSVFEEVGIGGADITEYGWMMGAAGRRRESKLASTSNRGKRVSRRLGRIDELSPMTIGIINRADKAMTASEEERFGAATKVSAMGHVGSQPIRRFLWRRTSRSPRSLARRSEAAESASLMRSVRGRVTETMCVRTILSDNKNSQRSWTMSTDDQGLFNVGSLGGTRNESTVSRLGEGQPFVGLMHVVNHITGLNDEGQMLTNEINHTVPQLTIVNPDRGIFGDGKFSGQQRKVDVFELVWIVNRIDVDRGESRADDTRDLLLGGDIGGNFFEFD